MGFFRLEKTIYIDLQLTIYIQKYISFEKTVGTFVPMFDPHRSGFISGIWPTNHSISLSANAGRKISANTIPH